MTLGPTNRGERLGALSREPFDVLVVGGGITGVGVARDAALRGLRVACVDRGDFGRGTSSRSSKLIHGGLRYLEQLKLGLVFEGTHERALLQRLAPHLVRPIPFLVPVYEGDRHGPVVLGVGLWMYDTLAGRRRTSRHRRYGPEALAGREPALRTDGLRGGAIYHDCMTDDARLVIENALSAAAAGATLANYVRFMRPLRDAGGRVTGAVLQDALTGDELEVSCRVLAVCAGPWTDEVFGRASVDGTRMLRTTKGVHALVAREDLPVNHAVVMNARADRRVLFAIPRGPVTLIGTTDTDFDDDPSDVHATAEDIEYLLETVRHYFPDAAATPDRVRSTYAGLRPLVRDDAQSPYDVSREHTIVRDGDGTVTIAGGKLTTFRRMAADVTEAVLDVLGVPRRGRTRCSTGAAALPGAEGLDFAAERDGLVQALVADQVPADVAARRVDVYGARHTALADDPVERLAPGFPYTLAEVEHAARSEAALTLEDVLVRRLPAFYELPDQGLECVEAAADRMAAVLEWTPDLRSTRVASYRETVAQSRRWATP